MRHPVVKRRGAPAAAGETTETPAGTSGRRRFAWTATALLPLLPLFGYLLLGDLVWSLKERAVQERVKAQLREFSQHPVLLNILFILWRIVGRISLFHQAGAFARGR